MLFETHVVAAPSVRSPSRTDPGEGRSVMDMLSQDDLRYLSGKRNRFCVSIFLPTRRAGMVREVEEGRIELKDLLRDAKSRLAAAGLSKSGVAELLSPGWQLARRNAFWRYQSNGLALFLAHGFFRYFRLPLQLPAFVTIEERFEITPLLPLWTSEDRFYVLALSLNQAKLFHGTRYSVAPLDARGLPRSLQEILERKVDKSGRQQHTLRPGLPEDELLYFRQIDKALRAAIQDQRVPLVLAGVEEAMSLYRQVNTYKTLLETGIPGSPDRLSPEELHVKARKRVEAYYEGSRRQAVRQYVERTDPAKTSHKLTEILPAAYQGRIYHLFVAEGGEKWGRFDPEQAAVTVHDSAERGDQELLNLAAIQTIVHGGVVYTLGPSEMPEGALIAALFRY